MDELNLNEQDLPVFPATEPVPDTPEAPAAEVSAAEAPADPQPAPRRRKPTRQQIFKEKYLPLIILGVAGLLILSFLFGSVSARQDRAAVEAKQDRITELLRQEAADLKSRAALMAAEYDYENAMKLLASYSGGLVNEPELLNLYNQYKTALSDLVVWDDLAEIPNLSFRTLVADLDKATADPDRGSRYASRYITTDEFARILNQLYENGYVLVSLTDFAVPATAADGSVAVNRTSIRLPEGKKPIILTQEGVNYYSHMEASGGFADSLTVNENGELTCLMTAADGTVTEGAYDLVPILNAFLSEHPDFSYEGARATIAVCGYEGLFGMDISEAEGIKAVADKLRAQGYDIACYTYADMEYADFGVAGLTEDMDKWFDQIAPVLGETDILVYPTGGDIKGQEAYSGSKYEALHGYGFRYFVGTASGESWGMTTADYARQQRTIVTADNLAEHPEWYTGMFDAATVLSAERG